MGALPWHGADGMFRAVSPAFRRGSSEVEHSSAHWTRHTGEIGGSIPSPPTRRPARGSIMAADVLYDVGPVRRLVISRHENCLPVDRAFTPGDEPVKLGIRDG